MTAPNEAVGQVGEEGGVLSKRVISAAVVAQADYEVANYKRCRTAAAAHEHYEAAMRAALSAIGFPALVEAAQRVTTAFRGLGEANIAQEFAARSECEDAMLALDAALRAVGEKP